MDTLKLAFCGLDCGECPLYRATVNDDNELRRKTALEWGKLFSEYIGKKELLLEDMNCLGCVSSDTIQFIGCKNCPIRTCSKEKNLTTCAECDEYAKCEMLNGFFTSAPQAKERLDKLRANDRL